MRPLPTTPLTPRLAEARNILATVSRWGDTLPLEMQLAVCCAYAETEMREARPFPPSAPSDVDPGLTVDAAVELCRRARAVLVAEIAEAPPHRAVGLAFAARELAAIVTNPAGGAL